MEWGAIGREAGFRDAVSFLPMKRICWLASYPKSGNTWMRLLLSAYDSGAVNINQIDGSAGDKYSYFWHAASYKDIEDLSEPEVACLRPAALSHMLAATNGDPLVVKTHNWNAAVDDIPLIPPSLTKCAVYIVRDPRDIIPSLASHYEITFDRAIEMMADGTHTSSDKVIKHYVSTWSNHVGSWLSELPYPIALVKYEHLLEHTEDVFATVLHFMGHNPDPAKVKQAVKACSFDAVRRQEQSDGFKEAKGKEMFFRRGKAGCWKDDLSKEQVARVEKDHGAAMHGLGYL